METNPRKESLQGVYTSRLINNRLRHLDVDDIYLLMLLGEGKKLADVARALSLSQPAITQRVHKIEQTLSISIMERSSRGTRLTGIGLAICRRAGDAMVQLEKFFDDIPRSGFAVAVTGAWSAWLMAAAITAIPDQWNGIDVEYISPEILRKGSRVGEEFTNVVVTMHRRLDATIPPGFVCVANISRPLVLWGRPGLDFLNAKSPLPLIEVSRDEALLSPQQREFLESQQSSIRGIRFAGTVAGAAKMAAKGHGLLVAPQNESELGLGLSQIFPEMAIGSVDFNLMTDDSTVVCDLIKQLIAALG